jgi:hypothetical protein
VDGYTLKKYKSSIIKGRESLFPLDRTALDEDPVVVVGKHAK